MTVPTFLQNEAAQMQALLYRISQLHPVDQFLVLAAFVGIGVGAALLVSKAWKVSQKRHDNAAATAHHIHSEIEKRNAKNGGDK